jgi:hypothetical protein
MNCPNCNHANPQGSDFCENCGWDFPPQASSAAGTFPAPATPSRPSTLDGGKCPHCNATNPDDAIFCGLCGQNLKQAGGADAHAAPDPVSEPAPAPAAADASEQNRQELDLLQRKLQERQISPEEVLKLAEIRLKANDREEAARTIMEGMEVHPKSRALARFYTSHFSEDELRDWGFTRPPVPVWSNFTETLLYPFSGGEWIGLLAASVFLGLGNIPLIGLPFIILGLLYTTTLYGKNIKWAALGRFGHPHSFDLDWSYFWYGFASVLSTIIPCLGIFILMAVLLHGSQGSNLFFAAGMLGTLVALLVGLYIMPMAFLLATLFNSFFAAFRYDFIIKSIIRIFGEYTICVILLFIVVVAKNMILSRIPLLNWVLGDFLTLYFGILQAHILGRLYFNNRRKLAWF